LRATEVIEIDLVLPAADLHGVLEGSFRQETAPAPLKASMFCMYIFVFSCATTSTVGPKNSLLPV
jgi:hypothetical protein